MSKVNRSGYWNIGLSVLLRVFLLVAILIVFPLLISPVAAALSGGNLNIPAFTEVIPDAAPPGALTSTVNPTERRSRHVLVNFDLFGGGRGVPSGGRGVGQRVELNLFPDTTETAIFSRVENNFLGDRTWIGQLDGVDLSSVIFVFNNGILTGKVASPRGIFLIQGEGNGRHKISEIDQAKFPDELPSIAADAGAFDFFPVADASPSSPDDGSSIDVMVLYTPEARAAEGSTAAMESLVALAVTESNVSYENSGISQRLNLVSTGEVTGASNDFSSDINALPYTDQVLDDVLAERDNKHADNVVLIIENSTSCGIGYFMNTVSTGFAYAAYAVVARDCATGYYSLGHELGHNMGATHDWYVNASTSPYTYVHGYVNEPDDWRTVMAYNNECSAQGHNCTRLPYWSNPDVIYNSDPMGVAAGTDSSCQTGISYLPGAQCDADNRLTLNNTASTVAKFRASTITWNGANWVQYQGNPGSTTAVALTPRIIDDAVLSSGSPVVSLEDMNIRSLIIEGGNLEVTGPGALVIAGGALPCDICVTP